MASAAPATENYVQRHKREAAEAATDILRVFAATGRLSPKAADLERASNSIATFPEAWRHDSELPTGAWMVLRGYSDGLAELSALKAAA